MGTWFGPLFWHEMRLLGRRSWLHWLRWAFFAVLVIDFATTVYQLERRLETFALAPPRDLQRRQLGNQKTVSQTRFVLQVRAEAAAGFFQSSIAMLAGLLLMLTPFLVASSITKEARAGRLDLLRVSGLHDGEVIAGLFLARVCYLALYPLGTLPLILLTGLLGGVDPNVAASNFAVLLATTFSLAALTLLVGLTARSVAGALALVGLFLTGLALLGLVVSGDPIRSNALRYLAVLTAANWQQGSFIETDWFDCLSAYLQSVVILSNPLAARLFLAEAPEAQSGAIDWTWRLAGPYVLINLLAAWLLLRLAVRALPHASNRSAVRRRRWFAAPSREPPYENHPFLWKELHTPGARWLARFCWFVLPMLLLGGGGWLFLAHHDALAWHCDWRAGLEPLMQNLETRGEHLSARGRPSLPRFSLTRDEALRKDLARACAALLVAGAFVAAVRAAVSVTGEKEKQTWDMLLTVPVPLRTLLGAKFLASLRSARPFLVLLGLIVVVGVLGGLWQPVVLLVLAAAASFVLAAAALGLLVSVYCSTSARALLFVVVGCLIAGVASLEEVHSLSLYSLSSSPKYTVLRGVVVGLQFLTALVVPIMALAAIILRGPRSRRLLGAVLRILAIFFFPLLIFVIASQAAARSQAVLPWNLCACMTEFGYDPFPYPQGTRGESLVALIVAGGAYLSLAMVLLAAAGGYAGRASGRIELQTRRTRRQPVPR